MSDSRWHVDRNKVYDNWRDVWTPEQKRFQKKAVSRHNRRAMKQRLIIHAHVIPAHGMVINQTGKTANLRVRPEDEVAISTARWQAMLKLAAME